MGELHSCCERLRPATFRLAAETEENDLAIGKTRFGDPFLPVLRIRIRIYRTCMFLGLPDPEVNLPAVKL
jgi:hypothetical protein